MPRLREMKPNELTNDRREFFEKYPEAITDFLVCSCGHTSKELASLANDRQQVIDRVKGTEYEAVLNDSQLADAVFECVKRKILTILATRSAANE